MNIIRISPIDKKQRNRDIPIDKSDYDKWLYGAPLEKAAPYLTEPDKEFILTGIAGEEWDEELEKN